MRSCTTHHHACDCREEKFKALEQEVKVLRAALASLVASRRAGSRIHGSQWLAAYRALDFGQPKSK